MSKLEPGSEGGGGRPGYLTIVAGVLVLALAVGAALWPKGNRPDYMHLLLVFDSSGRSGRNQAVYEPLAEYLAGVTGQSMSLVVVRTLPAYWSRLVDHPDFVFVPDGLALSSKRKGYLPLVVGRRAAPYNLRPRSVLVTRRSAQRVLAPWDVDPARTVFGDSLSLAATGSLRREGRTGLPALSAAGPDPYDHTPALHALRLGGFDYAVVRQWDAVRLREQGLLPAAEYLVTPLAEPVPDAVVMVSSAVQPQMRLRCREALNGLGRQKDAPLAEKLCSGLPRMHLVGFNLLLAPDFGLVEKKYRGDWLPGDG